MLKLGCSRWPGWAPVALAALLTAGSPAVAQEPEAKPAPDASAGQGGRMEPVPQELKGVGLDQKLGAKLPLQAAFKDEHGRKVTLGDYFDGKRPVLLTLNYFR
jgi:protein SCO1/2